VQNGKLKTTMKRGKGGGAKKDRPTDAFRGIKGHTLQTKNKKKKVTPGNHFQGRRWA